MGSKQIRGKNTVKNIKKVFDKISDHKKIDQEKIRRLGIQILVLLHIFFFVYVGSGTGSNW